MSNDQKPYTHWRTASELPQDIFSVWHKPNGALNPVAVVATADPDGTPHTAPFGSLRAVTPSILHFITWHGHDTYTNVCRDGRVTVTLLAPPDKAVSVRGHARVVKEQLDADEQYALVEVDIKEVKNDMVLSVIIESALTISARDEYREWFTRALAEVEKYSPGVS